MCLRDESSFGIKKKERGVINSMMVQYKNLYKYWSLFYKKSFKKYSLKIVNEWVRRFFIKSFTEVLNFLNARK